MDFNSPRLCVNGDDTDHRLFPHPLLALPASHPETSLRGLFELSLLCYGVRLRLKAQGGTGIPTRPLISFIAGPDVLTSQSAPDRALLALSLTRARVVHV